ncbi:MAG: hypothetical protein OXR84_14900 [Magnetovibrio sp.]|nr:hypothetical protein [Magnetovibrio sp.]
MNALAAMKLPTIEVNGLPRERLEVMAEAGARVLECYRVLQKSDANVVGEVLRDQGEFYEWDHYPSEDVYDRETHSQYYYHAHPPEKRANKWGAEHGHFHTFLRPKGMPARIEPAPLADYEAPADPNDALTHFVGVSMNRAGYPIRLFTTNRWVTGEVWYAADDVITMLEKFEIDQALPSWPVNVWITGMLQLFQPQIEALLRQRDRTVAEWEASHPGLNAYEDRDLEITSITDISVEDQVKKVDKALRAAAAA